ncbi:MAG: hypothetical protein AAF500_15465 [Myxococcota bacterium]
MVFELGTLAVLAALCGGLLALLRRRRPKAELVPEDASPERPTSVPPPLPPRASRPPEGPVVRSCPVCLTDYEPRTRFCVKDGASLIDGPASGPFSQGMICPTCRRGYGHDASFCPDDADELVPYGLYGASSSTRPPPPRDSKKICPECGQRHTSAHSFCGHDGAELVVVN